MTNSRQNNTSDNSGAFSRRIVTLLLFALLMSAVLTFIIYYLTVQRVYDNSIRNEYTGHAAHLAEKHAEFYSGNISEEVYSNIMDTSTEILDSVVIVYMYKENIFDINYTDSLEYLDQRYIEDARRLIVEHNYSIMSQRTTFFTENIGTEEVENLFVGYPIVAVDEHSGTTSTIGSVYIVKDMSSVDGELTNLNFSLILASALTFLIILFPILYFVKRLIDPLIETKNIAIAMNEGDFSQRANASSQDEIGDLARSINNLADDLDETLTSLRTERNRLEQIINGLSEGLLALDNNLEIMHINPALAELLNQQNLSDDELVEYILQIEDLKEQFTAVMYEQDSRDFKFMSRDSTINIHLDVLVDSENKRYGAVALFRDISEAENLERTRIDYISNISHELRTPLTAIRGLLEPIADNMVRDDATKQKYYKIILEETMRLSRLIDDMMSLSSVQSGQINVTPERIRPVEFLDEIYYKYINAMTDRGIEFVLPNENELEKLPDFYINEDRLEQVVVIILDNAMKFTDTGGQISIDLLNDKKKANSIILRISDTGVGIQDRDLNHIFERFYKTYKARGRSEGTGLGLSLAKEILGEMNERIWVESKIGEGTSFFVSISLYNGEKNE